MIIKQFSKYCMHLVGTSISETHGGPATGDRHWNFAWLLRDCETSRRNCPFNRVGVPLLMLGRFVQEFPSKGKRSCESVRCTIRQSGVSAVAVASDNQPSGREDVFVREHVQWWSGKRWRCELCAFNAGFGITALDVEAGLPQTSRSCVYIGTLTTEEVLW